MKYPTLKYLGWFFHEENKNLDPHSRLNFFKVNPTLSKGMFPYPIKSPVCLQKQIPFLAVCLQKSAVH